MEREKQKKKEERVILDKFLNSNYGVYYVDKPIVEFETPDFIVDNEGFEITKLTDQEGLEESEAYLKFCNEIELKLKILFEHDYSVLLIPKYSQTKYRKIKKVVEKEIINIVKFNLDKDEITLDFYSSYELRNNCLSQYFYLVEIKKDVPGTCGGPGIEMKDFSDLYEKTLRNKEIIFLCKKDFEINLIIYCWYDVFFTEIEILQYKINNKTSTVFKNVYVIFFNFKDRIEKIIKM